MGNNTLKKFEEIVRFKVKKEITTQKIRIQKIKLQHICARGTFHQELILIGIFYDIFFIYSVNNSKTFH